MNSHRLHFAFGLMLLLLLADAITPVGARDLAGVKIQDRIQLSGAATPLSLNGAGIRKKFFIDVYVAALYLPEQTHDAQRAIAAPGPKRVLLHFVHDVDRKKIRAAWREGFEENLTAAERQSLQGPITQFIEAFPDLHVGDVITLDSIPQRGTEVAIGAKVRLTLPGDAFFPALLKIWLGERPPTAALKAALLGD